MLVACTQIRGEWGPIIRLIPAMLVLLLIVRLGVLTSAWHAHRADLVEMHDAIDLMEEGGRLLVVLPDEQAGYRLAPPRHWGFHHAVHLASLPTLAVVEKSAFVSTLYDLHGQQPLVLKPPFDRLGGRGHENIHTLDALKSALALAEPPGEIHPQIRSWPSDYDYVLMLYGYGQGLDERTQELSHIHI